MKKTFFILSTLYVTTFPCPSSDGFPTKEQIHTLHKEPFYKSDCGGESVRAAQDRLKVWLNRIDLRLRQQPGYESVSSEMRKSLTLDQKIIFSVHISQAGVLENCDISERSGSKDLDNRLLQLIRGLAPFDHRPVKSVSRDLIMLVFHHSGLSLMESTRLTTLRNSRIGEFTGTSADLE
jgi:hypothetical protein